MKKALIIGRNSDIASSLIGKLSLNYDIYSSTRDLSLSDKKVVNINLKEQATFFTALENLSKEKISFDLVLFLAARTTSVGKTVTLFESSIDTTEFLEYFEINCISPLKLFEGLYLKNMLKDDCIVVFFSSLAGSINMRGKLPHHKKGGNLAYRLSKAALNMGVKNVAFDLDHTGMTIISLHPGWVKTKSGGENADLTIDFSTESICKLLETLNKRSSGKFFNYDATLIDW